MPARHITECVHAPRVIYPFILISLISAFQNKIYWLVPLLDKKLIMHEYVQREGCNEQPLTFHFEIYVSYFMGVKTQAHGETTVCI